MDLASKVFFENDLSPHNKKSRMLRVANERMDNKPLSLNISKMKRCSAIARLAFDAEPSKDTKLEPFLEI